LSKKKFIEGLESIFGEAAEDTLQDSSPLLSSSAPPKVKNKSARKRTSAKNFSDDLRNYLEGAFEESLEHQLEERAKQKKLRDKVSVKKRPKRPRGGLDSLIRSTIDRNTIRVDSSKSKRVTLVFDPSKLEKLKAIARNKKSYLKDIIDEIVAEYLDNHYKGEQP
jgi:hypothetical protein